jgi:GDP-mannose 6-dehydrogenase
MRVSVFGLGYVGCVTAACLAKAGHKVTGVDVNAEKVAMINAGTSPIVETGLDVLLADVVGSGRLRATTSSGEAVAASDLALICVGTPGHANGQLGVEALVRVCEDIGHVLATRAKPFTVVLRSTMLPGTVEKVILPALLNGAGGRFRSTVRVAVNPEFMREGTALKDFAQPPMILAGCDDDKTAELIEALYRGVEAPFVCTRVRNAEMIKYSCNAYHALKVCFANEIGDLCQALGADAQEVMRIFRLDKRLNVSEAYLQPGFAFGGSCLPKDVRALVFAASRSDVPAPLLSSILPSNEIQIRQAVDAILATGKRRIGIVGLAFKPGTDDLRESPMVRLVEALIGKGCEVRILDRNVSIARLMGANRRYIEEEIPHIASLMCVDSRTLLNHAETIVFGSTNEEAAEVLGAAESGKIIVDLTRGVLKRPAPRRATVSALRKSAVPGARKAAAKSVARAGA